MVDNKETLISEYTEKLKKQINPRNLKKYVQSYMKYVQWTTPTSNNNNVHQIITGIPY